MKMYKDEANKNSKDTFDEYTTRDEPRQKSFYDHYGFDERNGQPEEDDEAEDNEPWGKSDLRRW